MPRDFHREAIAKYLIPDRPQEDNYPDKKEFEEKEEEWEEQRDQALASRTAWVEQQQIAEARRAQEAAAAAAEKTRLRREAAERKQKAAAQKKVGAIVEVITRGKSVCARCSLKGEYRCRLSASY